MIDLVANSDPALERAHQVRTTQSLIDAGSLTLCLMFVLLYGDDIDPPWARIATAWENDDKGVMLRTLCALVNFLFAVRFFKTWKPMSFHLSVWGKTWEEVQDDMPSLFLYHTMIDIMGIANAVTSISILLISSRQGFLLVALLPCSLTWLAMLNVYCRTAGRPPIKVAGAIVALTLVAGLL